MPYKVHLILTLIVFTTSTWAENLNISGTVLDDLLGTAIQGAVVTHSETGSKDTTDSEGSFSLSKLVTSINDNMTSAPQHSAGLVLRENSLQFTLQENAAISLNIYTARGSSVYRLNKNMGKGVSRIALPNLSNGFYLFQVEFGGDNYTFKSVHSNGKFSYKNIVGNNQRLNNRARNSRSDELGEISISHEDYITETVNLESWEESDIEVRLQLKVSPLDQKRNKTKSELEAVWAANSNISPELKYILEEILLAEDEFTFGEYEAARARVDEILETYPLDSPQWGRLNTGGEHFGNPPGYTHLRILDEATKVALYGNPPEHPDTIILTLMAVQGTSYEKPDGTGDRVFVPMVQEMKANNYANPREAANIFQHFVYAISGGKVRMEFRVAEIDSLEFNYYPHLENDGEPIPGRVQMKPWGDSENGGDLSIPINLLEQGIRDSTDMFWLLYPPPPTDPAFDDVKVFISGGVGMTHGGAQPRPLMLCWSDDLLKKNIMKHRIYRINWFQHEYMHHAYDLFPEFNLEPYVHSYSDRSTWPDDFVGRWEQDYAWESVHKRFKGATPDVATRIKASKLWK